MERIRYAAVLTSQWAQTVRFAIVSVLLDAAVAAGAYGLTAETKHGRVFIVIGAVILGTVVALGGLFAWAFMRVPWKGLLYRVDLLEAIVAQQRSQLIALIDDRFGDIDQFVPVYHQLRTDLKGAIRLVENALDSGQLWGMTESLEDSVWKKYKEPLATHPWARADDTFGPLNEAFQQVRRLTTLRGARLFRPFVHESDDLRGALIDLRNAVEALDAAIGESDGLGVDQLDIDDLSEDD